MRRPRFGSILCAVAVATAGVLPIFAIPASATTTCGATGSPAGPGAVEQFGNHANDQSTLAVGCVIDFAAAPTPNANHIDIHDSANAIWNRGAARTVSCSTTATTGVPQTITCAAGTISARDIGRPVSGPGIFSGGLGDVA